MEDQNGSDQQIKVTAGHGVMIDSECVHRVRFSRNAVVKSFIYGKEPEFPLQGDCVDIYGFDTTGVYSGKDLKIVKFEGSGEFPKHSHSCMEWMEVLKGYIIVYCYKVLAMGLLLSLLYFWGN